jgi:putative CocE/NonD family hydrolase
LSPAVPSLGEPSQYNYDPADPTPAVHGPSLESLTASGDMAKLEARRDVLRFTSGPLDADFDAIGPVSAELFIRSSLEHTDFFVCLCDVDPRGRSTSVCDGYLRLRPGLPAASADGTRRAAIECWPTAYRFRRGHRLRVLVSSGAHPRYARNPGSGEPLGEAVTLKVAHQQIFHDREHPTAIVLSVI